MDRWLSNLTLQAPRARFERVVALGDSLTDVAAARGPSYFDHLAARLGVECRNLAVSGSTVQKMVRHQLPLAVAERPTFACIWIGGNDFLAHFFDGSLARGDLSFLDASLAHLRTALDVLRGAGTDVALANLTDLSMLPISYKMFRERPEARAWIRSATLIWNERLADLAESRGAALVDLCSRYDAFFECGDGIPLADGRLQVPPHAGARNHLFHDPVHPSAVSNGFVANAFMDTLNWTYGTQLLPLRDWELARLAGLLDTPLTAPVLPWSARTAGLHPIGLA